jgi:hypothetical protein
VGSNPIGATKRNRSVIDRAIVVSAALPAAPSKFSRWREPCRGIVSCAMIFAVGAASATLCFPVVFAQYSCRERILTMQARGLGSHLAGVAGSGAMTALVVNVVGIGNELPSRTSGGDR